MEPHPEIEGKLQEYNDGRLSAEEVANDYNQQPPAERLIAIRKLLIDNYNYENVDRLENPDDLFTMISEVFSKLQLEDIDPYALMELVLDFAPLINKEDDYRVKELVTILKKVVESLPAEDPKTTNSLPNEHRRTSTIVARLIQHVSRLPRKKNPDSGIANKIDRQLNEARVELTTMHWNKEPDDRPLIDRRPRPEGMKREHLELLNMLREREQRNGPGASLKPFFSKLVQEYGGQIPSVEYLQLWNQYDIHKVAALWEKVNTNVVYEDIARHVYRILIEKYKVTQNDLEDDHITNAMADQIVEGIKEWVTIQEKNQSKQETPQEILNRIITIASSEKPKRNQQAILKNLSQMYLKATGDAQSKFRTIDELVSMVNTLLQDPERLGSLSTVATNTDKSQLLAEILADLQAAGWNRDNPVTLAWTAKTSNDIYRGDESGDCTAFRLIAGAGSGDAITQCAEPRFALIDILYNGNKALKVGLFIALNGDGNPIICIDNCEKYTAFDADENQAFEIIRSMLNQISRWAQERMGITTLVVCKLMNDNTFSKALREALAEFNEFAFLAGPEHCIMSMKASPQAPLPLFLQAKEGEDMGEDDDMFEDCDAHYNQWEALEGRPPTDRMIGLLENQILKTSMNLPDVLAQEYLTIRQSGDYAALHTFLLTNAFSADCRLLRKLGVPDMADWKNFYQFVNLLHQLENELEHDSYKYTQALELLADNFFVNLNDGQGDSTMEVLTMLKNNPLQQYIEARLQGNLLSEFIFSQIEDGTSIVEILKTNINITRLIEAKIKNSNLLYSIDSGEEENVIMTEDLRTQFINYLNGEIDNLHFSIVHIKSNLDDIYYQYELSDIKDAYDTLRAMEDLVKSVRFDEFNEYIDAIRETFREKVGLNSILRRIVGIGTRRDYHPSELSEKIIDLPHGASVLLGALGLYRGSGEPPREEPPQPPPADPPVEPDQQPPTDGANEGNNANYSDPQVPKYTEEEELPDSNHEMTPPSPQELNKLESLANLLSRICPQERVRIQTALYHAQFGDEDSIHTITGIAQTISTQPGHASIRQMHKVQQALRTFIDEQQLQATLRTMTQEQRRKEEVFRTLRTIGKVAVSAFAVATVAQKETTKAAGAVAGVTAIGLNHLAGVLGNVADYATTTEDGYLREQEEIEEMVRNDQDLMVRLGRTEDEALYEATRLGIDKLLRMQRENEQGHREQQKAEQLVQQAQQAGLDISIEYALQCPSELERRINKQRENTAEWAYSIELTDSLRHYGVDVSTSDVHRAQSAWREKLYALQEKTREEKRMQRRRESAPRPKEVEVERHTQEPVQRNDTIQNRHNDIHPSDKNMDRDRDRGRNRHRNVPGDIAAAAGAAGTAAAIAGSVHGAEVVKKVSEKAARNAAEATSAAATRLQEHAEQLRKQAELQEKIKQAMRNGTDPSVLRALRRAGVITAQNNGYMIDTSGLSAEEALRYASDLTGAMEGTVTTPEAEETARRIRVTDIGNSIGQSANREPEQPKQQPSAMPSEIPYTSTASKRGNFDGVGREEKQYSQK